MGEGSGNLPIEVLPIGYETSEAEGEHLYVRDGVYYRFDPGRDAHMIVEPRRL